MTSFALILAALEIVAPKPGSEIVLLPHCQKAVLAKSTLAERVAVFEADKKSGKKLKHDTNWRKSRPVVFQWRATGKESGPWEIKIAKNADFSDARVECLRRCPTNSVGAYFYELPQANFEIGAKYYWKVTSDITCGKWAHPRACDCKNRKPCVESSVGTFTTEDLAPRWIDIEGRVENMRDLGGRTTLDGRRVRQGLVYRGQGLNDNSVDGVHKGRNRLTVEDVAYLTKTLGIKTDLDLRSSMETAGMRESPLGSAIRFVHRSSRAYDNVFTDDGKKIMADNFRLFCDRANYPIYFHCIAGADRTGALGYTLNAVLGVSEYGCATDWESTFYPGIPGGNEKTDGKHVWNSEWHLINGFAAYGTSGDSLKRRAELYLLDCGVTMAEIEKFRAIMLK